MADGYDHIVVGGGSAGCTLAARLSEDPARSVLLLEAGPSDWNPWIHLPVAYYKTTAGPLTWRFSLAPQTEQGGIEPGYPQARVLGGGSSINAQVYIRGSARDYDIWAEMGAEGWSYADVMPWFIKAEGNNRLGGPYHGQNGPLGVSDQRFTHPLSHAFVEACREYGMPLNPDFNGSGQAGCGLYQVTNRNGRRCSAAVGYLHPARRRRNLTVLTGAQVTRIVVERGRAVAIEYCRNGRTKRVTSSAEIVLAAGAINSPKLLMLSGLGPAGELRAHNLPVLVDIPAVGLNLHDHIDVFLMYRLRGIESYDAYKSPWRQIPAGLQYLLTRRGPVAATVVEGGAFWARDAASDPTVQFHFLAGTGVESVTAAQGGGNGCTLNAYYLHPRSRGQVRLASADPAQAPLIDPAFFADPHDLEQTIDAVHMAAEIMARPAIARHVDHLYFPKIDLSDPRAVEAFVRREARSGYHPVGTCRMGHGPETVVDPRCCVHGVSNLRVADSSIMPRLVSGNTNAPTIMIAERCAAFLKGQGSP